MGQTLELAVKLTAVDLLGAGLRHAERNILQLGKAGKQVQRDFDAMTAHLEKGLKLAAGTQWAANMVKPGVRAAADLQAALLNVEMSLMEAGKSGSRLNAELERVKNTAFDLQKITPFSGVDIVQIEAALQRAGVKIDDIVAKRGAAWAAAGLSTIEGPDKLPPGVAAESLAAIATPFKIPGAQWGDLADVLQRGSAASISSVSEMSAGMGYAAQQASQMKISVKDTVTALAVLSQHGKSGTEAGTGLAGFLTALNPVEKQKKDALTSLFGKKNPFFENGKMVALPKAVEKLRDRFAELNDQQKQAYAKVIFGQEHMASALSLLDKEGPGTWEAMTKAMEDQADMAQKLEVRQRGLLTSLQALGGNAKTTAGMFFEPWLAGLTAMTKKADALVSKLGEMAKNHPEMKKWASGGLAAGIAGLGGAAVFHLVRAAWSGKGVLKGLGGIKGLLSNFASTGAGIGEGLAVNVATAGAVVPVFVTNWAQGFGGSGSDEGPPAGPGMTRKILDFGKRALPAAGMAAAPATATLGFGALSMNIGQWWAEREARSASTEELERLRMAHEVMGGGKESYQYQRISEELARRVFETSRALIQTSHGQLGVQASHASGGRDVPVNVNVNIDENRRVYADANRRNVTTTVNLARGHLK